MWFDLLNYPSHLQQLLHMQKYLELSHSLHVMQVANATPKIDVYCEREIVIFFQV